MRKQALLCGSVYGWQLEGWPGVGLGCPSSGNRTGFPLRACHPPPSSPTCLWKDISAEEAWGEGRQDRDGCRCTSPGERWAGCISQRWRMEDFGAFGELGLTSRGNWEAVGRGGRASKDSRLQARKLGRRQRSPRRQALGTEVRPTEVSFWGGQGRLESCGPEGSIKGQGQGTGLGSFSRCRDRERHRVGERPGGTLRPCDRAHDRGNLCVALGTIPPLIDAGSIRMSGASLFCTVCQALFQGLCRKSWFNPPSEPPSGGLHSWIYSRESWGREEARDLLQEF